MPYFGQAILPRAAPLPLPARSGLFSHLKKQIGGMANA